MAYTKNAPKNCIKKHMPLHGSFILLILPALCVIFLYLVSADASASYSGVWQPESRGRKVSAVYYRAGKYRLTVSPGGKTLTAGKLKSGAAVRKTGWKKSKSQLWTARKNRDGSVSFLPVKNRKLCLGITGSGFRLKKAGSGKSVRFRRADESGRKKEGPNVKTQKGDIVSASDGAKEHGFLKVSGTRLVDESGKPVILHGMSSHGLQWYSKFASSNAVGATASYGANLFRAAMYTEEGGYLSDKDGILKMLYETVDGAIARNMYVIVDWHILSDGNPLTHESDAKTFFRKVARRYADTPNVIYEICNEPNGGTSWKDIKNYASHVIPVIREESPKSVIIVGTPTWSQDVDAAAADPLSEPNVLYAVHFYAGTHGQWLRDRVSAVLKEGIPVFVSEWGTSSADGNGGVFKKETKTWLDFMNKSGLSWANWSLSDKAESSAALKPGSDAEDGISCGELSESGKLVFSAF